MPRQRIPKPCYARLPPGRGCPNYADSGSSYCAEHRTKRSRTTTICQSSQWQKLRRRLLEGAQRPVRCAICSKVVYELAADPGDRPELDHIEPIENGGAPFDPANLRWLCKRCNGRKRNKVEPKPSPAHRRKAADRERRLAARS